ncbi:MAG: hypothetical protein ABW019_13955 [Chitinophagaceae bacterium]
MKTLSLFAFLLTALVLKSDRPAAELTCTLTSDKAVYTVGELPRFTVRIINQGTEDIYLPGSLDGSDVKWRFPHCYFSISKPVPDTPRMLRCGNMNTLRPADFRLVPAGQPFDPYLNSKDHGFFSDYFATNPGTFKHPGTYRIRFHYSTNSQELSGFMGDNWPRDGGADSLQLQALFKLTPKVELESNEIVIRIDK